MENRRKTVYVNLCLIAVLVAFMGLACGKTPQQLWETSGHADSDSLAFRDWDDPADPNAVVQANCASCHSTTGFEEYLTHADYSRTIADPPLATENMGITCEACHSDVKKGTLREPPVAGTVHFTASGQDATGVGASALICGQCHQGRSYYGNVDTKIATAFPAPIDLTTVEDVISADLGGSNPHYRAAFGAIKASKSQIGYTYGNTALQFDATHAGGTDCMVCHNQHSTAIDIGRNGASCQPCHQFTSVADVLAKNNFIPGAETQLLATIIDYAADDTTLDSEGNTKAKACIAYDDAAYPYWFNDADCDGVNTDNSTANQYKSFTPRLAKACYNYLVSKKDPGGFAHNSAYIKGLLAASIANLKLYNPLLGE